MRSEFSVLLLAGASGTAKTSTALEVGRRLGFNVLSVDDLRMALQRVTTRDEHPALHQFLDHESGVWSSAERYAQGLIEVADVMSAAIEPVVEHHLRVREAGPIVVEGDGVGLSLGGGRPGVRTVVLVEREPQRLRERIENRGRGFSDLDATTQETVIDGCARYGAHLEQVARREYVPVIEVEPLSSIADRVLTALS